MSSAVTQVHSAAELAQLKQGAGSKLVVVYYTAVWCGPCQQIRPRVDQMSLTYPNVVFAKVDIDELQDVAQAAAVRAVPTFEFYKNNARIAGFAGAEVTRLEALVKQHGGGSGGGDDGGASSSAGVGGGAGGMTELNATIDKQQAHALNQSQAHPFSNLLTSSDTYLESDADEQLLIDVPFQQAVKLHSIRVVAKSLPHAPKKLKIFANAINMGFDEAESATATQDVELSESDLRDEAGALIQLKFVRFQRVNNVVLFVQSNQDGEDVTRVNHVKFYGQVIESTDMKNLKKPGHSHDG